MVLTFHLSSSSAFFNQNCLSHIKFFFLLNWHSLSNPGTVRLGNLKRVIISGILASALLALVIIPHLKSLKTSILPILTLTSVTVTYIQRTECSLYKQFCILMSLYITVWLVYFQIRSISKFLATHYLYEFLIIDIQFLLQFLKIDIRDVGNGSEINLYLSGY